MGCTGSRYGTPSLASGMPPTSLAITGTPRSMASTTMRDRASAHSDGTSSTRVRASSSSISSTGSSTLYVRPRGQRLAVAPVGAPGWHGREGDLGQRVGQVQEDRDALHRAGVHHGDEFVVESPHCRPRPGSRSEMGTCTASIPRVAAGCSAPRTRLTPTTRAGRAACAPSWPRWETRSPGRRARASVARARYDHPRARRPADAASSSNCAGSSVEARMTSGRNASACAVKYARRFGIGHHVHFHAAALERHHARGAAARPRRRAPPIPPDTCACSRLAERRGCAPPRGTRARARPAPPSAAGWICRRLRSQGSTASSAPAGCASASIPRRFSRSSSSARFSGESDSIVARAARRPRLPGRGRQQPQQVRFHGLPRQARPRTCRAASRDAADSASYAARSANSSLERLHPRRRVVLRGITGVGMPCSS